MSDPGASSREPRIGVYGGTFNPIHLGHLRSAEQVAKSLGLERILFVPSARPPHKADGGRECIAPAEQRLEWVELAVAGDPRFAADPIEVERGGASYSVDTLEALVARLAPTRVVFIIGHDAFVEMGTWREPERIFAMVDIAVTTRPPVEAGNLREWLPACVADRVEIADDGVSGRHRETGTRIELVEIDALDVSASEIRSRLGAGKSVSELLPGEVAAAVEASRCYNAGDTGVPPRSEEEADFVNEEERQSLHSGEQAEEADQQPPLDPERRRELVAKANSIVEAGRERNARDPVAIDVSRVTSYTDGLVIMTGNSDRQVRAIADNVARDLKARDDAALGIEGMDEGRWVLIDANDVIVHVFDPETRELFNLESLWSDGSEIEIQAEAAGAPSSITPATR